MNEDAFDRFLESDISENDKPLKSRLLTLIVVMEKLRASPTLDLGELVGGVSQGVKSHETFGKRAVERLDLRGDFANFGRRSNELDRWGPNLMAVLRGYGVSPGAGETWRAFIEGFDDRLRNAWQMIYRHEPLRPNFGLGTAIAVLDDLLAQADAHGTSAGFAQLIVLAKIERRLGIELPTHRADTPDRVGANRARDRAGDIHVGDAVFEVTLAGPDHKHARQCARIIRDWKKEAWLLVRAPLVNDWLARLADELGTDATMATVMSLMSFVGQNMAELGSFQRPLTQDQLSGLFEHYNDLTKAVTDGPEIVLPT